MQGLLFRTPCVAAVVEKSNYIELRYDKFHMATSWMLMPVKDPMLARLNFATFQYLQPGVESVMIDKIPSYPAGPSIWGSSQGFSNGLMDVTSPSRCGRLEEPLDVGQYSEATYEDWWGRSRTACRRHIKQKKAREVIDGIAKITLWANQSPWLSPSEEGAGLVKVLD
jgi:hypothetical protein